MILLVTNLILIQVAQAGVMYMLTQLAKMIFLVTNLISIQVAQAGVMYMLTQLAKMIFLATFISMNEVEEDEVSLHINHVIAQHLLSSLNWPKYLKV